MLLGLFIAYAFVKGVSSEGRVMFILTGEGRKPAKTAEERADLLGTLVAYTGTYRIEGDRWIIKVDVAWNPESAPNKGSPDDLFKTAR